jgi:predicted DNA-binding protein
MSQDKSIQSFNLPTEHKRVLNQWAQQTGFSKSRIVELMILQRIQEEKVLRDQQDGKQTTLEIHQAPSSARIWGEDKNKCNPKLPVLCVTCWGSKE